jgi:dihydrofolate reductase
MRKIKLYIATSLNGMIATANGSVDWLEQIPNENEESYGYDEFYNSIDTTIQGYNTYKQILEWGIEFPYKGKKNYVVSNKQNLKNTDDVEFITQNPNKFISEIKNQKGKDIWLIGGGTINTALLSTKLIDEIQVFIMPIILSNGISIFESLPNETNLRLIDSKTYSTGAIEIKYGVEN